MYWSTESVGESTGRESVGGVTAEGNLGWVWWLLIYRRFVGREKGTPDVNKVERDVLVNGVFLIDFYRIL